MPATDVCGGTISGDAAVALEEISGAIEFTEDVESGPVVLNEFVETFDRSESFRERFCEIYTEDFEDRSFARIYFRRIVGEDFGTSGDEALVSYSTGEAAYVMENATLIYFPCPVDGEATHDLIGANLDTEIDDGSQPDREMAILNSVSRAVAERLGCLDESGLAEGTPERLAD